MKDMLGQPLDIGDRVAMDVAVYRSSALRVGTITHAHGEGAATYVRIKYNLDATRTNTVQRRPGGVVKVAQ